MLRRHAAEAYRLLRSDAARWVRPQETVHTDVVTPIVIARLLTRYPALRAMGWLRFGSAAKRAGIPAVPSWAQRRLLRLYGLEIPTGAAIAGGLYIAHPVGCVLVAESIGVNVTVIGQVTFGTRDDGRWPIIGDETFFGIGARILGGISVGNSARVGANAVVLHDVAPNMTVAGIPARPLHAPQSGTGSA